MSQKADVVVKAEEVWASILNSASLIKNCDGGICVEIPVEKISNRFTVAKDDWIHLAPVGTHSHPKNLLQVVDERSLDSMVANFKSKKENDPTFPGLLLDFDHKSQDGNTEAGGWIMNLQKRDNGLWGQVKWSNSGKEAVEGGKYRLISPVWKRSDCEDLGGTKIRPLVLDSAALTNDPNMKGLVPIST